MYTHTFMKMQMLNMYIHIHIYMHVCVYTFLKTKSGLLMEYSQKQCDTVEREN